MQEQTPTLRVVNAEEIKPIEVWERLYPDPRCLLNLLAKMNGKYEGKLIATAVDPMELVGRSYDERGIVTLETRGEYTEPQPAFVG